MGEREGFIAGVFLLLLGAGMLVHARPIVLLFAVLACAAVYGFVALFRPGRGDTWRG